jgi:hypothetical protein
MNKNNLKILILSFISVFSLLSCTSDDSEGNSDGVTTGDYYPLAENNNWHYDNNGEESTVFVAGINDFQGVPYYRLEDSDIGEFEITNWIAKKGASYYQKVGEVMAPLPNGTTLYMGEYEIKLFKDDLPVGGTWKGSLPLTVRVYNGGAPQTLPASLKYTGTVLEKDATATLGAITYTNIIKVQVKYVEKVNSQITNITTDYWFAKDIGLIRESLTSSTDNVTKTRYLVSYTLN